MSSIIKNTNIRFENQDPVVIGNTVRNNESNGINYAENDLEDSLMTKLEDLAVKIEDAEKRYKEIVEESDKMMFDTNNKAEKILNDAKIDGENKGYLEGKRKAENELNQMKLALQDEYDLKEQELNKEKINFLANTKDKLRDIIDQAFVKVFENEVKHSNNLLNVLIMKGLRELSDEKEVRILLSEDDYNIFDKDAFIRQLGNLYSDKIINISFDKKLTNGSCLIETSFGYIDASLNHLSRYVSAIIDNNISESNDDSSMMSDEM